MEARHTGDVGEQEQISAAGLVRSYEGIVFRKREVHIEVIKEFIQKELPYTEAFAELAVDMYVELANSGVADVREWAIPEIARVYEIEPFLVGPAWRKLLADENPRVAQAAYEAFDAYCIENPEAEDLSFVVEEQDLQDGIAA